jgi:hypothetical protein
MTSRPNFRPLPADAQALTADHARAIAGGSAQIALSGLVTSQYTPDSKRCADAPISEASA